VSAARQVLELHDLDQVLELANDRGCRARLERAGFRFEGAAALERERARMLAGIERRWSALYERSLLRYGRGLTLVRERVCQGCFVTLPTSAAPAPGEAGLHLCESCGRLLYWR
jgi:predicted  nucleic acid-binding Zn-ribbon protein